MSEKEIMQMMNSLAEQIKEVKQNQDNQDQRLESQDQRLGSLETRVQNLTNSQPSENSSESNRQQGQEDQPQEQPDTLIAFKQRLKDGQISDEDRSEAEEIVSLINENIQPKGVRLALVNLEAEQQSEENFLNLDENNRIRWEDYQFPGSWWDDRLRKYVKVEQKGEEA